MSNHTSDVAGGLGPLQDLRQGVDCSIEEKGRQGITLPYPASRPKIGAHLPININGSAARHNGLHDPANHAIIKPPPLEGRPKKGPIQTVIGLLEIKLQEHALLALVLDFMDDLMKS